MDVIIRFLNQLKIVASPTIFFGVIAAVFYLYQPNTLGIFVAILIFLLGLTLGILWARRISKKMDPTDFNARVMASPDFDEVAKNDAKSKR